MAQSSLDAKLNNVNDVDQQSVDYADQATPNESAICGICMKESFKNELISCSECGLGGKQHTRTKSI